MPTFSYQVLPDLSDFEAEEAAQVQKLIEEYEGKRSEWGAEKTRYYELQAALAEAQERDQRERAEALRAGKKDPGHKHAEKIRQTMADVEDKMGVLEAVLSAVESDLGRALAEARPALIAETEARVERARRRFNEAVRAMREAHDAWTVETGLERWCLSPSSHVSTGPPNLAVLSVSEIPGPEVEDDSEGTVRYIAG